MTPICRQSGRSWPRNAGSAPERRALLALLAALLLAALLLAGCTPVAPPQQAPALEGSPSLAAHILVDFDGEVALQRSTWREAVPALFGATVKVGDQLFVEPGKHAELVCTDLTVRNVWSDDSFIPCPEIAGAITRGSDGAAETRLRAVGDDVSAATGFHIVSPRAGYLHPDRPFEIRWTGADGVSDYLVTLKVGESVVWEESTGETSITVGPAALPLRAGRTIELTVQDLFMPDYATSQELRTLEAKAIETLEEYEAKIDDLQQSQGLADAAHELLLARLAFERFGLYAEALGRLETLYAQRQEVHVAHLLGQVTLSMGLTAQAQEYLWDAFELARVQGDLEAEARAALQLADIAQCDFPEAAQPDFANRRADANALLDLAEAAATRIGDAGVAAEVARIRTLREVCAAFQE